MSAPPYMPLYVADYLADTTHLSTLEHGAYCLLLMSMWRSGGTLPDDDTKLAKFARMTAAQWARVSETVMAFFTLSDGVFTQGRLAREMDRHANVVRQRRESGSRGGRAKSLKDKGATVANATLLPCQPELEPELEERDKESLSARDEDFARFWSAYPKKVAKPVALKAFLKAKKAGANIRAVMDGLERAKRSSQWVKDDGKFIPHPASWLNAARWEDQGPEIEPDPPGTRRLDNGHLFNPNAFV